jgi:transketolase
MPSWELFEQQDPEYQELVLPEDLPTVSVEAGVTMGWERYADDHVAMDRFGASAPASVLFEKFGFTPENVARVVTELLEDDGD